MNWYKGWLNRLGWAPNIACWAWLTKNPPYIGISYSGMKHDTI